MPEHDDIIDNITERYERRLSDECGRLRVESVTLRADMNKGLGDLRADMNKGLGDLRAEMIERNAELLKWGLGFWVAQVGVMAALIALIR